jgi:methionyl-tRNA formyltransferase
VTNAERDGDRGERFVGAAAPDDERRRPRVVFLGSGRFAVPILRALADDALAGDPRVELVGVVTAPPRPAGRGGMDRPPPVGVVARSKWLALLTPARLRDPESVEQIRALRPDVIVLADYGQIVPRELLDLPPHGALNVHPSLLPRHRGASPIATAILEGDAETGVTVIRMDSGIDTGPIVLQEATPLRDEETAPELEARLAARAADLVPDVVASWVRGELEARSQPAEGATVTRPLKRADGRLDPRRSAADLARQVRAYQPWPGSFFHVDGGRVIVWRASPRVAPAPDDAGTAGPTGPGTVVADGDGLGLVTADGLLALGEVQFAGGRRMTGAELRRGRPGLVGSRVGTGALA